MTSSRTTNSTGSDVRDHVPGLCTGSQKEHVRAGPGWLAGRTSWLATRYTRDPAWLRAPPPPSPAYSGLRLRPTRRAGQSGKSDTQPDTQSDPHPDIQTARKGAQRSRQERIRACVTLMHRPLWSSLSIAIATDMRRCQKHCLRYSSCHRFYSVIDAAMLLRRHRYRHCCYHHRSHRHRCHQ